KSKGLKIEKRKVKPEIRSFSRYCVLYFIFFTSLSFLYCSLRFSISSASFFILSTKRPYQGFMNWNSMGFPEKPTVIDVRRRKIPFIVYPAGTRYTSSERSLIKFSHSFGVAFFRRISKSYSLRHTSFLYPYVFC